MIFSTTGSQFLKSLVRASLAPLRFHDSFIKDSLFTTPTKFIVLPELILVTTICLSSPTQTHELTGVVF